MSRNITNKEHVKAKIQELLGDIELNPDFNVDELLEELSQIYWPDDLFTDLDLSDWAENHGYHSEEDYDNLQYRIEELEDELAEADDAADNLQDEIDNLQEQIDELQERP